MKPILMIAIVLMAGSLAGQNTPPTISISMNGAPVPAWSIQYVAGGTTIAALNLQITVDDAEGSNTSLDAIVANGGGTDASGQLGISYLEWASGGAAVAYTKTPTSGSFNNGSAQGSSGSSEIFNIWFQAYDGTDTTVTGFKIWVNAPAQPPTLSVTQNGLPLWNTAQISVADGASLASLGLSIATDDPAGEDVTLSGSINNTGTTGMLASEFGSSSAATPYSIQPSTGTYHQPGFVHVVRIWAQNQSGTKFLFEFSLVVIPAIPAIDVSVAGSTVQTGQPAIGTTCDFGTISVGGTSTLHVLIQNSGTAELNLGTPAISSGGGEFTIVLGAYTTTVPAGGATSFDLEFKPTSVGDWDATVSFTHDAPAGSTFDLNLHGAAAIFGAPAAMGGGGSGGGGCTAETGSGFGLLAILGLLLFTRRRRFV